MCIQILETKLMEQAGDETDGLIPLLYQGLAEKES